jgi:hypothetical protein
VVQKKGSKGGEPFPYFFLRLTIASAIAPSMMPAMIDSHGNPGIAGNVIGVETVIVLEVLVVVGVLTTVIVETEVLTTVVIGELVVVTDAVETKDVEVLTCETVEEELKVVCVLFCVVVAC